MLSRKKNCKQGQDFNLNLNYIIKLTQNYITCRDFGIQALQAKIGVSDFLMGLRISNDFRDIPMFCGIWTGILLFLGQSVNFINCISVSSVHRRSIVIELWFAFNASFPLLTFHVSPLKRRLDGKYVKIVGKRVKIVYMVVTMFFINWKPWSYKLGKKLHNISFSVWTRIFQWFLS